MLHLTIESPDSTAGSLTISACSEMTRAMYFWFVELFDTDYSENSWKLSSLQRLPGTMYREILSTVRKDISSSFFFFSFFRRVDKIIHYLSLFHVLKNSAPGSIAIVTVSIAPFLDSDCKNLSIGEISEFFNSQGNDLQFRFRSELT